MKVLAAIVVLGLFTAGSAVAQEETTAPVTRRAVDARPVPSASSDSPPPPTLARAEWEHIQRILADTGGNVSETARRLGITRRTLQLKLKKYPPRI